MLSKLKNIIAGLKKDSKETSSTNKITNTRLAAAVIMLEMAHVDGTCSQEELDHIQQTIQSSYNLSEKDASEIIESAKESREDEVDLWQFTNNINESLSHAEKLTIIESIWEIIYVDGHLEQHEDSFAHQLAKLLRLSHEELITAKMKVKRENK